MEPYHSSSSAGSSHAYGSLPPTSLSALGFTEEQWEEIARPLAESQQPSFSEEVVPSTNMQETETQPSSEIPSSSTGPSIAKNTSKSKSNVWNYFDKVMINGDRKAKCKLCANITYAFPVGAGTGALSRHIRNKHPDHEPRQQQISTLGGSLSNFSYNKNTERSNLAKFLIRSEQPLSLVEHDAFADYIRSSHTPHYEPCSRNTIKNEMFKQYNEYKNVLIAILSSLPHRIALTSDGWEAVNGNHYLVITAHFIDVDWVLNKRIIGFKKFPHPHSAYNLSQLLFNVAKEYNIDSKISSISLDNASENTAAIEHLKRYFRPVLNGQLFHIRCVCHIINLCVQDGL